MTNTKRVEVEDDEEHEAAIKQHGRFFVERLTLNGMWAAGFERPPENPWADHAYIGISLGRYGLYRDPFTGVGTVQWSTRNGALNAIKEYRAQELKGENFRVRSYVHVDDEPVNTQEPAQKQVPPVEQRQRTGRLWLVISVQFIFICALLAAVVVKPN